MSLSAASVNKRTVTTFTVAVLLVGGMLSFFGLGQLEDPEFTIKTAAVTTLYPGASAEEVELEVTNHLEMAIQEMTSIKDIESFSRAGLSVVKVNILSTYTSDVLPEVWVDLRKKIADARGGLPPGAQAPMVGDDFGDVFGFLLAVVGDGYTYAELKDHVDGIKKELSLIKGVARVELWGDQSECIYIDVTQTRLASLGLAMEDIQNTLAQQNVVVNSGGIDVHGERLRIETTGMFESPEDIADLVIRGRMSSLGAAPQELIRIRDIGTVRRGYVEPAFWKMRQNGQPSIGIAVSNAAGVNIVNLGHALDVRLNELVGDLPIGVEVERIAWQSDLVDASIKNFMISLAEAVAIVLIVLWLFMGFRTALIVGTAGLMFTIIISFFCMKVYGVDLQRMSLGALVIAMGMMVDNAIVVADGILTRFQKGMDRVKAAIEAASQPSIPLLGATVVAVMAFYPIYSSTEGAGEYCATLFSVVAISLMISWVLAVTITPVMCLGILPKHDPSAEKVDPYASRFFSIFRNILAAAIRFRWAVLLLMVVLLTGSAIGFRYVNQMFFPASAREQFMIDYWAPEGTRIQQVSADLHQIEAKLTADPAVDSISTFIGQGPPRFYLPVEPESPYASYGQLIVNTHDYAGVQALIPQTQAWVDENVPQAIVVVRKYGLGPSETWPIQVRISGPAIADPDTLRDQAQKVVGIIEHSPHTQVVRTNWRQRVKKLVAQYDQRNGRWTGISRSDVADTTRRAYDGMVVGQYRENDKLMPIMVRHSEEERLFLADALNALQVRPPFSSRSVPLSQVTTDIDVQWEDPLIWRWDRRRAITVQAVPVNLATTLRADVVDDIDALHAGLPPGYKLEWDGEYLSSKDAQASLIPGVVPAVCLMAIIIVGLFNAYRPPLIIVCIIPFALIGVTVGLLVTGQPFGFVALLGAMSLVGMMIKNAIVLLDQINIEKDAGKDDYQAVIEAAMSRLRPVVLAAATTVLGVIPLLQDVFWVAMAVTIMFGLAFGTVLTMIGVPVLYCCFFRVPTPRA
jgi:multidrug efflux pump subunit AcrB